MKQYRLKIPEKGLTKDQLEILAERTISLVWLVENQGSVLTDPNHEWPDFVLEEIKDELMSAEEWLDWAYDNLNSHNYPWLNKDMLTAFNAGAAEDEKKHLLRQTLPEASIEFNHRQMYTSNDMYCFRQGWKAHAKATNTEA